LSGIDSGEIMIERLLDLALTQEVPADAQAVARLSLADWLVCGLAGRDEPLAHMLRDLLAEEGGRAQASVFGGHAAPSRSAAWANGAISHALDYDDTHFAHVGHPSVAIFPAALALAEARDAPASAVPEAFAVGAEASIRIGLVLGAGHYARGFHQTATAGTFGATIAAGRVLGLDRPKMRTALGLAATRAAGLRGQFGTMGKPLNAGNAAATGVEAAILAQAGFTSAEDGLAGPQGFLDTHSDALGSWHNGDWLLPDIRYKLHACCHGTHAMIEALRALKLGVNEVAAVRLRTAPRWLTVCDLKRPTTGLEVKFSYAWLAAMVLAGRPTAEGRGFTDALVADPALEAIAARVQVTGDPALADTQAAGEIVTADGWTLAFRHDLAGPLAPEVLASGLRIKAEALLGAAEADRIRDVVTDLDRRSARDLGALVQGAD